MGNKLKRKTAGGKATEKSLKCYVNPFQPINLNSNYKIPDGATGSLGYSEQWFASVPNVSLQAAGTSTRIQLTPWTGIPGVLGHYSTLDDAEMDTLDESPVKQYIGNVDKWDGFRCRLVSQGMRIKCLGDPDNITGYFIATRQPASYDLNTVNAHPGPDYTRITGHIRDIHKYDFILKPSSVEAGRFTTDWKDTSFDSIVVELIGQSAQTHVSVQFVQHVEYLPHGTIDFRGQDPTTVQFDPIGLEQARIKLNSSSKAGTLNKRL